MKGTALLAGFLSAWRLLASAQLVDRFDADEKTAIAVIVSHIIPTDKTPGAQEAGVAIDLEAEAQKSDKLRKQYRLGLQELDRRSKNQFGRAFVETTYDQQDALLHDIANSEFFRSVRSMTLRRFYNSRLGMESVGYPGMGQPHGHRDFDQPPRGSGDEQKEMEAEMALPAGEGEKEVAASCGQCHELNVVTSQRKTREQWQQSVRKMVTQYHAQLEPTLSDKIVAYLSQYFGPQ